MNIAAEMRKCRKASYLNCWGEKWLPLWRHDMRSGKKEQELRQSQSQGTNLNLQKIYTNKLYIQTACCLHIPHDDCWWWLCMLVEWLGCKHVIFVYRLKGICVGVSLSIWTECDAVNRRCLGYGLGSRCDLNKQTINRKSHVHITEHRVL